MVAKAELIGQAFGRLTVIRDIGSRNGFVLWLCRCVCGNEREVTTGNLTSGNTKSCGCLNVELVKQANTTHGMSDTKIYKVWQSILDRCNNKNAKDYKYYGKRNISVCSRWFEFENFYADMGDRPKGRTIDRIDNDGNYEPSNCHWATHIEQARNRRPWRTA